MCAEPRDVGRLRPERMLSAEVGTGGDSSRHERGSSLGTTVQTGVSSQTSP